MNTPHGWLSRMSRASSALAALLAVLSFSIPGFSQTAAGRVVGIVTDPGGAVIVGARVTVTNTATGVHSETTTRADGSYQVLDVPVGMYTVSIQEQGFQTAVTQPAEVTVNQTVRVDVRLALGAVSQTVAVEAQATQVETENPTIGGTVNGATVSNLPLNGRNTLDLALTQPGVVPNPNTGNTVAGTFSVAGGRPDSVSYLLDGADNNSVKSTGVSFNPNPDTVAEFRILTNNYTAEYGRSAGGIVSVVTKSGTNELHGSLFEYLRNEDLNASDFFSNKSGQPKPVLKRSQFGGTIGGPIVIPKVVNGKDKLFFFFGYQGQRQTQTAVGSQTVTFTPAELQGNFSQAVNGKPDPNVVSFLKSNPYYQSNSSLAAQGIIDPTKIDPVTQSYIKNNLITTSPTGLIVPEAKQYNNANEVTGKVDIVPTTSDRIAVTVGWQSNPYLNAIATLGYPIENKNSGSLANVDYTKTIRPNLLNEARAAVNRYYQILDKPASRQPFPQALGTSIRSDRPDGPVQISLTGALGVGFPSNEGFIADNTYTYSDTLTWIKGRHTFKTGASFAAAQDNSLYNYQINGVYYFYGSGTSTGSGNSLADFLFGLPDEYAQEPSGTGTLRQKQFGVFAQDEWKVTPRLLLTIGLRYEYDSPQHDIFGRTLNIIPGHQSTLFPSAPLGAVWAGDPGAPKGAYFPDKLDFAPRFGFAWDPFGKGRTSLRGGFGMFYDALNGWNLDYDSATPPFYAGVDLTLDPPSGPITSAPNVLANPFAAQGIPNPFPSPPNHGSKDPNYFANQGLLPYNGGGEYPIDPRLKTPYIYQYNLSLQQQIGQSLVMEINYVGSDGHRLIGFVDANPIIIGTTKRLLNVQGGYPTSTSGNGFGAIPYELSNVGTSSYNGLVTSLTKRFSDAHRFGSVFFTAAYTWSHAIDNVDGPLHASSTVPYYDHDALRGNSDFDIRQRFVLSGGWELPFNHLWERGPKKLTSGWSLFPIFQDQSGRPLHITAGVSQSITRPGPSGDGDSQLVNPNLVTSSVQFYDPRQVQTINGRTGNFYFNPADLNVPSNWRTIVPTASQITYGSLGRNSIIGPGLVNLDLALEKRVDFERVHAAFRAEFFNVLNHTEFTTIGTSFSNGLLGQATAVNPPRIGQLALRLGF